MARASGRLRFSAETTSRPLPSPSRKSTTANAGAARPICASPSDTVSQEVTVKPRVSMARDRRSRNGLSSSTIRSERSACSVNSADVAVKGADPSWLVPNIWRGRMALPRPYKVDCPRRNTALNVLRRWLVCTFSRLEAVARPGDMNDSAMIGKGPVGKRHFRAGALQQRAGDEHAEAEPAVLAFVVARPPRQERLADPLQHVGRDAGAVVGNHELDDLAVPPGVHLDGLAGEIDRVFQDVADAIEDRRIARADRLAGAGHRDPDLDRDAEIAMRRHHFLDQGRERHAVEGRAARGKLGDLGQNVAAALRLLAQRFEIGGEGAVLHRLLQLARNQKNRRQRR